MCTTGRKGTSSGLKYTNTHGNLDISLNWFCSWLTQALHACHCPAAASLGMLPAKINGVSHGVALNWPWLHFIQLTRTKTNKVRLSVQLNHFYRASKQKQWIQGLSPMSRNWLDYLWLMFPSDPFTNCLKTLWRSNM